jgi:DNA modification methylase
MTPYYQDDWLTVMLGDCREVMASMEPESVHCVVTSPPYWGLRDYGTATWTGGDEACDHLGPPRMSDKTGLSHPELKSREQILAEPSRLVPQPYKNICGKCGATRVDSQLGLEPTPEAYVESMVAVFREVRRVLRSDGTVWLNLGDSYASSNPTGRRDADRRGEAGTFTDGEWLERQASGGGGHVKPLPTGLKPKDLVGIPWRVAFALQADGWYLRSDIIWAKPNPMPESVTDRPTKAHEYLFLLSKSPRYYYDADAVREAYSEKTWFYDHVEPTKAAGTVGNNNGTGKSTLGIREANAKSGRNLRSVWTIATQPYPGAHFATFPQALVEPCIKAGTSEKGVCPECGAPWERVVERTNATRRGDGAPSVAARLSGGLAVGSANHMGSPEVETTGWKPPYVAPSEIDRYGTGQAGVHRKVGGQYQKWLDEHPKQTVGWNGPCKHEGDPVPATVLDPFAGSGTTGLVAQRLSRRAVLIDLNGEYLEQVMDRNRDIPLGLGA